ncbi:MerR family transcriptional regulator [Corynebacterium meitnerae]|uniref:MerR family transcriptional regulator n=1 Tax=Corynebacterium meitnerae TaxID=2913498 RepID=UPI003B8454F7
MKLGEHAAATDRSTATIKYYIREGLLPPGAKKNQTTSVYGPAHRERLELISALRVLHDLEYVDPGVQLPGVNQAPQDVVVEVAEPLGDPP